MDLQIWLAFVGASSALLLIPGPTVLTTLSYAINHGRPVALATVAGVALGDLIAMSASLAGLGAIVLASATLFTALKWVGGTYLIYLGVRMLRSASPSTAAQDTVAAGAVPRRVFLHVAAVTALNPKSIVFFLAFVPQFIAPESALLPQFAVLIATFVGLAVANALAYALLADRVRRDITRPAVRTALLRVGGGVLISMGLATVALRRSTTA